MAVERPPIRRNLTKDKSQFTPQVQWVASLQGHSQAIHTGKTSTVILLIQNACAKWAFGRLLCPSIWTWLSSMWRKALQRKDIKTFFFRKTVTLFSLTCVSDTQGQTLSVDTGHLPVDRIRHWWSWLQTIYMAAAQTYKPIRRSLAPRLLRVSPKKCSE